ncbi:uncharacterized protein CC84DRAFT_1172457 [Paraphaeosphaeria sporulosa]|uniref:Uncharacterized protein n=1 Tax=Paraphaeosphaeria sporulosa TaxID=1460663 RepID=A0A177CR40_9PLEO|nr:uncharacterized protein CC84DRAFT_1172457 [Paraphaeosphaeria sporulosa]OAG09975.1 hypothetical protein CC84DRAFT_1172457 [Paraphaeosphaeria sporulosa]
MVLYSTHLNRSCHRNIIQRSPPARQPIESRIANGDSLGIELAQEIGPDLLTVGLGGRFVRQRDIDARLKPRVGRPQAICGDDEGTGVLTQETEEDGHKLVALEVVDVACRPENICLVNQANGFPFRTQPERRAEACLDSLCGDA